MVVVLVLLTIVVFIVVNVATRLVMKRMEERRLLREREEALDIGLRLEFTEEAESLKRVEVESPRGKILAVDDEPVILDSFRKILVLHGYSVDTVESGREAVGLVQKRDYDFVFTDLKMPEFDGLEVTKAVRHLRPDIDVIMITGYGTIESAVAAMTYGAMDYVQKPFTEDELVAFTDRALIRRNARIEQEMPRRFHLLSAAGRGPDKPHVIHVARGVFVTPQHSWLALEMTGELRVGVDDFCVKSLQDIDQIELPRRSQVVKRGDALFTLRSDGQALTFTSPVDGEITRVNERLADSPELLRRRPYHLGWVCCLDPKGDLAYVHRWTLGAEALSWYEQELEAFQQKLAASPASPESRGEPLPEGGHRAAEASRWEAFRSAFFVRKESGDDS